MKHIQPYLNESIGRGAVVLITGKPIKGKRRLYATHVLGYHELRPGVVMLFLSDSFYRIKEVDGRLGLATVSYRDEDSLKSTLNLKSPGKISIVRNANKTPFHWKTLKHNNIQLAIKELEPELLGSDYLLESSNEYNEYDQVYDAVGRIAIDFVFDESKKAVLLDFETGNSVEDNVDYSQVGRSTQEIDYEVTLYLLIKERELAAKMQELALDQPIEVVMTFQATVDVDIREYLGGRDTPDSSESEIDITDLVISELYVDGETIALTPEEKTKVDAILKKFNDEDIVALLEKKKLKFKQID